MILDLGGELASTVQKQSTNQKLTFPNLSFLCEILGHRCLRRINFTQPANSIESKISDLGG